MGTNCPSWHICTVSLFCALKWDWAAMTSGDWKAFSPSKLWLNQRPHWAVLLLCYLFHETTKSPCMLTSMPSFLLTYIQIPWISREMGKSYGASSVQQREPPSSVCAYTLLLGSGRQVPTFCIFWAKSFNGVKLFKHPKYTSVCTLSQHLQNCWGFCLLPYVVCEGDRRHIWLSQEREMFT